MLNYTCSNCNAPLEVSPDALVSLCIYCGTRFQVVNHPQKGNQLIVDESTLSQASVQALTVDLTARFERTLARFAGLDNHLKQLWQMEQQPDGRFPPSLPELLTQNQTLVETLKLIGKQYQRLGGSQVSAQTPLPVPQYEISLHGSLHGNLHGSLQQNDETAGVLRPALTTLGLTPTETERLLQTGFPCWLPGVYSSEATQSFYTELTGQGFLVWLRPQVQV